MWYDPNKIVKSSSRACHCEMRWQWQKGCDFDQLQAAAAKAPKSSGIRRRKKLSRMVYVPYHMMGNPQLAVQNDLEKNVLKWDNEFDAIVLALGKVKAVSPAIVRDTLPGSFLRIEATAVLFAPVIGAEYEASVLQTNGVLPKRGKVFALVHDWVPCSVRGGRRAKSAHFNVDQPSTSGEGSKADADFTKLSHGQRIVIRVVSIDKQKNQVELFGDFVRSMSKKDDQLPEKLALPSPFKQNIASHSVFTPEKLESVYDADLTFSQPHQDLVKSVLKFSHSDSGSDEDSVRSDSDTGKKAKKRKKKDKELSELSVKAEVESTPVCSEVESGKKRKKKRKQKNSELEQPENMKVEEFSASCSRDDVVVDNEKVKKKKRKRSKIEPDF